MLEKIYGYILIIVTLIIWGSTPIVVKFISTDVSVNIQLFIRHLTQAVVMFGILGIRRVVTKKPLLEEQKIKINPLIAISFFTILNAATYILSIYNTDATLAALIAEGFGNIIPSVIVAIFIISEREIFKKRYIQICIAVSFLASIVLSLNFNEINSININIGALYMVISQLAWGFFVMNVQKDCKKVYLIDWYAKSILIATLFFGILIIANGELISLLALDFVTLAKLIMMGLLIDCTVTLTYYTGIKIVSVVRSGIILVMTPVLSVILGNMFLGEKLSFQHIIAGIVIILINIYMVFKDLLVEKDKIEKL